MLSAIEVMRMRRMRTSGNVLAAGALVQGVHLAGPDNEHVQPHQHEHDHEDDHLHYEDDSVDVVKEGDPFGDVVVVAPGEDQVGAADEDEHQPRAADPAEAGRDRAHGGHSRGQVLDRAGSGHPGEGEEELRPHEQGDAEHVQPHGGDMQEVLHGRPPRGVPALRA